MTTTHTTGVRSRIEPGVLMSLGARNLRDADDALTFDATILPLADNGTRAERARTMTVTVIEHGLNPAHGFTEFGVYVSYPTRGTRVTHYQSDRIPAGRLNRTLLALDYDGDQTLNPRYA